MSLLNLSAGGKWITSYLTLYSNATSNVTSNPYYYNVSTSWNYATSWNSVTSVYTGVISYTSNLTSWTTSRGTSACVEISSFIYGGLFAENVSVGDTLILADEKTLEPGTGKVSYSETKDADGWELTTKNGAVLVCSDTAPIPTSDGLVLAPKTLGKSVGTFVDGVVSWNEVVSCIPVGKIKVQHITVGDKCFWAGRDHGKFILHHNVKDLTTYYDTYFSTSATTTYATGTSYLSYYYTANSQITTTTFLTSYYTAGYYTTSYTTSYNVLTNRTTGNV